MASYLSSIPVSIPYSWQKRLLLFALDRLDFIDTKGLDLDNLGGLTWGRRSVVELKNVSIKISTLAERANLPTNVAVEHAAVATLRLTVPADLGTDPIHIEIEGVRITARLRKDESTQPTGQGAKSAPSYKDKANRPRLASPSVHDPGGRNRRDGHGMETSHVIPTSEDLAASFLQFEPRAEREELEAIVGGQSQYMAGSVSSNSSGNEDDTGLGLQGGFALPTFLINYFQGIADRLTLQISDVQLTIRLELAPLEGSDADETTFILALDAVDIGSLKRQVEEGTTVKPPRRIALRGIHLDLDVEEDVFSHPSSPRLDRQSIKSSSSHLRNFMVDDDRDDVSDATSSSFAPFVTDPEERRQTRRTRRPASRSLVPPESESSIDDEQPVPFIDSSPPTSPRINTEQLPTARTLGASDSRDDPSFSADPHQGSSSSAGLGLALTSAADELSESALFTHDQAESMYASAMSYATAPSRFMPGGWEISSPGLKVAQAPADHNRPGDEAQLSITASTDVGRAPLANEQIDPVFPTDVAESSVIASVLGDTEEDGAEQDEASTPIPQHAVPAVIRTTPPEPEQTLRANSLRLASLEYISIVVYDTSSQLESKGSDTGAPLKGLPRSGLDQSLYSSHMLTMRGSPRPGSNSPDVKSPLRREPALQIETGQLKVDVDLGICKLLVRTAGSVHRILSKNETRSPQSQEGTASNPGQPGANVKLGEISLNLHEGRNLLASIGQAEKHAKAEDALLSLCLKDLQYADDGAFQRRLTIMSINVRHAAQDVLWFVDSVNVRESIASSAMLRPHDLTLTVDGERTEVQIKAVHMVIDLLLVDEVLSRGGGLDSLLELGNSIMSTHNAMSPQAKAASKPQQRTVRFNAPDHNRSRSTSDTSGLGKLNIRVNGSIIDLLGSEASIQVKTSAIKFVVRPAAARVVVDGAIIEGPILERTNKQPPIYVKVKALEVVYCDVPEETDLDRLLSLITPSNDKFDESDDIMVDTLLKQRRKAGVLRTNASEIQLDVQGLEWQQHISKLTDELAKLSSVTKYLPEDDRPGLLTFTLIKKFDARFSVEKNFGPLVLKADLLEGAHIAVPSLAAAQISKWTITRGKDNVLIGEVLPQDDTVLGTPMLMCRFIAGEMEPTVRLKLTNTCVEYKVQTLVDITSLVERLSPGIKGSPTDPTQPLSPASSRSSDITDFSRKIKVSVAFRDSAVALYPTGHVAKGLLLLSDAVVGYGMHKQGAEITVDLVKTSLLVVNSVEALATGIENADEKLYFDQDDQIQELTKHGYVLVASLSSASVQVKLVEATLTKPKHTVVELSKALLFLETCADSTQTLSQVLSGLSPPSAPSTQAQFRTEVVPIENMLASFTGNAFVSEAGPELGMDASRLSMARSTAHGSDHAGPLDMLGSGYEEYEEPPEPAEMMDSFVESDMASSLASSLHIAPVDVTAPDPDDLGQSVMQHSMLDFREAHFNQKADVGGTAHRWNSTNNTYEPTNERIDQKSPLKVKVRNVHVIWNLFDGYDWQETRDTISQAVKTIEEKAMAKRPGSKSPGMEEDDEDVVGDVLFNSIYISIPASKDPRDLTRAINQDIDDMVSETGSYATSTTVTATPSRQARRQSGLRPRTRKLKLNRSKHHKISFELQGLAVDFIAFPPDSGEVQSSVDIRVNKLEIFDHVPTSTWKKFATYLHDAGEREMGTSMVHVELLNVRPIPELAASEIVMKLTVLPLRLHVDQDALDFMARFFDFKDDSSSTSSTPSDPPFIQRVEVNPIRLQLDYKPKKVDYAGLRSGRTTEFMNFLILDRANIVLRRVILYGVSGFDRMGIMLNNIWSPDVRRNQLPTVLAGLAPVRPLVDVASGMANLISVPIAEYQKDGRIVRSIQKGALTFAKTTATNVVNLGAKLAIGTQQVLQNTEEMLVSGGQEQGQDDEATRQISLYADQPVGIVQGLRGAYASLERDLLLARDAIVAVPGEAMATGTAAGAARAMLKQSPTIILRPAIGATKAVGQTLMGAGNTLDKGNLRRVADVSQSLFWLVTVANVVQKYKRH
jgi:autophagy-related protein 2